MSDADETKVALDAQGWPINPTTNRFVCTQDYPMPKGAGGRWEHSDVVEVGEQKDGWPSGDVQGFRCRICGHTWEEELPQ
jgi:hypothetical protein